MQFLSFRHRDDENTFFRDQGSDIEANANLLPFGNIWP